MIRAEFYRCDSGYDGFQVSGHAGYAAAGADIVCAGVTSAVQLTCNGITEILGMNTSVAADGDTVRMTGAGREAQSFIEALKLHLELLSGDYPQYLKITVTEV